MIVRYDAALFTMLDETARISGSGARLRLPCRLLFSDAVVFAVALARAVTGTSKPMIDASTARRRANTTPEATRAATTASGGGLRPWRNHRATQRRLLP